MRATLRPRERQCLDYIAARVSIDGVCPSVEEITAALGATSKATGHRAVSSLVRRGYLRRLPNKHRALELTCTGIPRLTPRKPLSHPSPRAEFWVWDDKRKKLKPMEEKR